MNQRNATFDVGQSPTTAVAARLLAVAGRVSFLQLAALFLAVFAVLASGYSLSEVNLLGTTAAPVLLLAFVASAAGAFLVVKTQHWHGRFSMDADLGGVQKSHTTPVPRIGGLAVLAGFLGLLVACGLFADSGDAGVTGRGGIGLPVGLCATLGAFLACGSVAFFSGLLEDLTKRVSVGARLFATVVSGVLAAVFLDAYTARLDIPLLDSVMTYSAVAIVVSAVAVGGVANAVNIIDGFNGLAAGALVIMGLGFALLTASVNDPLLVLMSLGLVATAAGFMLVNYPSGKVFLGDGGAYLLGYWLGEIAVLTLARHPEVSCWTVLTLLAYPVVEVAVSVVRRKLAKASPGAPDRGHLHQQIQLALKHVLFARAGRTLPVVNPQVSPFAWGLNAVCTLLALQMAGAGSLLVVVAFFAAALSYLLVYRTVKMFNTSVQHAQTSYITGLMEITPSAQAQFVRGLSGVAAAEESVQAIDSQRVLDKSRLDETAETGHAATPVDAQITDGKYLSERGDRRSA